MALKLPVKLKLSTGYAAPYQQEMHRFRNWL